ncbi:porin family protein [Bradyrhizobium diazoefficiens]|nr:outer membrane beta-barrel protein [Bradyrhizobium diazoefficiens]MBR0773943.1 porin family protein [Bradyrhizobium diazoefficiens]
MVMRAGLTFAGLIMGTIVGAGGAAAADLRLPAPPQAQATTSLPGWAGPYLGVQAGYLSGRSDISFSGTDEFHFVDPKAATVGGTAGYSAQWGRIVGGIEGDVNFVGARATIDTGFPPVPSVTQLQTTLNWNSHLRGRIGYTFDRTLLFASGGLAIAGVEDKAFDNASGAVASWSDTRAGWSIGAGAEHRFAPQASVRLEYLYDNYGSKTLAAQTIGTTAFGARESRLDTHTLRAGVYWRF